MRRVVLLLVVIFLAGIIVAQTPETFSYQAIVRDGGDVLTNQNVSYKFSIIKGDLPGTVVYTENHSATTNGFGLVNLAIGGGTDPAGDFSGILWGTDKYFLKVELDPGGGSTFTDMGTTQLMSVPYALHAKTASGYTETDPVFGAWDKSTGISITESQVSDLQSYLTTETQSLSDILGEGNDANGLNIKNLADPVNAQDAVTKEYIKGLLNRLETLERLTRLKVYSDSVTDFEGNKHRAIDIGNQTWMADNLQSTKYSDGTDITGVYTYDNDESNVERLGRLYTWDALMYGAGSSGFNPSYVEGVCPDGWHVPSDAEWKELEMFLGMSVGVVSMNGVRDGAGGKLKSTDQLWDPPNEGANNNSGFDGMPSGTYTGVSFSNLGTVGFYMTSTEYDATYPITRYLHLTYDGVGRDHSWDKNWANAVRCVKNNYPLLHNTLGSVSEVENSAYGPDGTVVGSVNFNNDVVFGKGITPNTGSAGSGVDFSPTMLNAEAGCIEFWSEFYAPPVAGSYGVYGFVNCGHWQQQPLSLYWHNVTSKIEGTLGFGATNIGLAYTGFNPALDTPVHIALVWDRNGIDGSADYVRIYLDGVVVATSAENTWGTDNTGYFRVAAPWDSSYSTDRYSVDNIKVWDYAKTDFANRIFE